MTLWKRFHLLIVVALVMQSVLGAQPVNAGRGSGFSIGEFDPIGLFPIVACSSGVELEYIYLDGYVDVNELNGAFDSLQLTAGILAPGADYYNGIVSQAGTSVVTVPLTSHVTEIAYNPLIDKSYDEGRWKAKRLLASASERIPENTTGNLRLYWSEFGLQPKVNDRVVIVPRAPALGDDDLKVLVAGTDVHDPEIGFNDYLDWLVIMVEIKDNCEGTFSSLSPNCTYSTVDIVGTDLDVTVTPAAGPSNWDGEFSAGVIEFSDYETEGLQSILPEVIGQISLPDDYNPDGRLNSVYVNLVESMDETDPMRDLSVLSAHGYVYSSLPIISQLTSNFTATVVSFLDIINSPVMATALPAGLTLYNTYNSIEPHVNLIEPTFRYVGGEFSAATDRLYFAPLVAPTTLKVTGVYLNNLERNSAMKVSASAGGVSVSQTPGGESKVNIVELFLPNVPRGTNQLDFTIEAPGSAEDTALLTGITLSYPCLDAVDNFAEIKETRTAPLIDGVVDPAWQSASSYSLKSLLIGNGPITDADFSVNFRSLYDNDNLYMLIETTDDALYNDSGDQLALDDTVELYLDPNFSQGLTYDKVDDRATFFRWNDPITYKSPQSPPLPPGLQKNIVNTTNGYLVELRLPLSEIGLPPTPGYLFGLDVHAHDDDNGGEQEHKLAWNALGSGIHRNPSLMGIGRLVAAANTLPIANDDAATTQQNTTLNGATVLANDSDPDGDPLTVNAIPLSGPSNGSLVLNSNGTYIYTPNSGFVGNDSFVYEVSDGKGGSDTATVTITVTAQPVNRPPVANDDAATVQQNTTLNGTSVLANDSDPDGDLLTVTVPPISGPSNGSLVLNSNGTYVYTPNPGFVGNDGFVYEISDGKGGSDTATVTVSVTITAQPVNRPPVANDDAATVQQNTTLNGATVLANDSDPDGDSLTVTATPISGPSNGSLILNSNGTYVYTPNPGFVGNDSFIYEVADGHDHRATATVRITVQKTNRPPVANPDSATTAQDTTLNGPSLLANDSDPDGDLLAINTTPVTGPTNGTLVLNANGTYVYRPTAGFVGTDRFTYEVSDRNGGRSTAMVTITITSVFGTSLRQYYLPFVLAN